MRGGEGKHLSVCRRREETRSEKELQNLHGPWRVGLYGFVVATRCMDKRKDRAKYWENSTSEVNLHAQ
jgi:hypothetical protein